jgi:hypothetical protein
MREASAMYGFHLRDRVWEQHGDVTRKFVSTRLIVHLTVASESRHPIGHIQQARDQVARPWHGQSGPCPDGEQP